ncbi:MAG: peptidase domain protein [Rickettsiales bacterium]|jgi:murein DD-endopeptidase MepM/ murein hydrolase activator NlpD|nr:peptidase domain protein [Rickettsiales bacterium]
MGNVCIAHSTDTRLGIITGESGLPFFRRWKTYLCYCGVGLCLLLPCLFGQYRPSDASILKITTQAANAFFVSDPTNFPPSAVDPTQNTENFDHYEALLKVAPGDTLSVMLDRLGIPLSTALPAVSALKGYYNPSRLRVGQFVAVRFVDSGDGDVHLEHLAIKESKDLTIQVAWDGEGYIAQPIYTLLIKKTHKVRATIESSLYASAVEAGVPEPLLMNIIQAYSYDVDFQRDIQKGDTIDVFFEGLYRPDGSLAKNGKLLYARLYTDNKPLEIYLHNSPEGFPEYYTPEGKTVRKALLRTPIDGARLTSGFGTRRHPVLGYTKMHKGVDFAAPTGTPIYASGNGVIERANHFGAYGNYVRIKHNATFASAYAHLTRFKKGIRPGVRVKQGDIIGYVGTTGRSTGPHLHYEIIKAGQQVNPSKVKFAPRTQLAGKALKQFIAYRNDLNTLIASMPETSPLRVASREELEE